MNKGAKLASDVKFFTDYSKYSELLGRSENWEDSVTRVMNMHRVNPNLKEAFKNKKVRDLFQYAEDAYKEKLFLGSQRALQFGGDPILKHNAKIYNCTGSYADRPRFFQEALYLLLCGCGVGFSVQKHHVQKMPSILLRDKGTKTFVIPDSIEGWSDAVGVLMSSYFEGDVPFPEYQGYIIHFDYSLIRPRGSFIAGGFKAPGPDGLRNSIMKCEEIFSRAFRDQQTKLKPIQVYDIIMHLSDAVLSGGVRRSATLCLFSLDDADMMSAKTGNWFNENPQRGRSNNSVVLVRSEVSREDFHKIMAHTKEFGEPGFVFVDHRDICFNPCVEISFWCYDENGQTGWQGCNLTEGNAAMCTTKEIFFRVCKASAILGTIQATYTTFPYLGEASERIFRRESLLGCSFTGWMDNPDIMLDEETMREGAKIVRETNAEMVKLLQAAGVNINVAARTTCVKPAGNSGTLLGTSKLDGAHSPKYFRNIQLNKENEIAKYFADEYPSMVENSVYSAEQRDYAVSIPIESQPNAIYKDQLYGTKLLDVIKSIQTNWVSEGTNVDLCVKPFLRHNVSNTVSVEDWDPIPDYLYDNKEYFTAVSFLSATGDKDWNQAPYTSVLSRDELVDKYSDASLFASGLIIDALHAFDDDLWKACDYALSKNIKLEGGRMQVLVMKDWIRRAKQFAKRFFRGNMKQMTYCLKDVHLYHKWIKVNRDIKDGIDISKLNIIPEYVNVDTLGALACAGGACEIN